MIELGVGQVHYSRTNVRMEIIEIADGFVYFAVSPWTTKRLRVARFKSKSRYAAWSESDA